MSDPAERARSEASENADVIAAIADAVRRRDLDQLLTFLDPEIEHRDLRLSKLQRGHPAIREYFVELWSESPDAWFAVDELVVEGDWVIVRQRWHGLSTGELTTWVARRFVDGRVRRIDVCSTRAEALKAARLS